MISLFGNAAFSSKSSLHTKLSNLIKSLLRHAKNFKTWLIACNSFKARKPLSNTATVQPVTEFPALHKVPSKLVSNCLRSRETNLELCTPRHAFYLRNSFSSYDIQFSNIF